VVRSRRTRRTTPSSVSRRAIAHETEDWAAPAPAAAATALGGRPVYQWDQLLNAFGVLWIVVAAEPWI
jgi:hypothetical protein